MKISLLRPVSVGVLAEEQRGLDKVQKISEMTNKLKYLLK